MTFHGTYVMFVPAAIPEGQKTPRWNVVAKEGHHPLGEVKWFGRWRKFCFFPNAETVYEEVCLRDISRFIEERTKEYRDGRRAAAG